jgi:hypothetical protein
MRNIKTAITPGATIRITLDLHPVGVKNIRIVADSAESRDWAVTKIQRCMPQIELLESAFLTPDEPGTQKRASVEESATRV